MRLLAALLLSTFALTAYADHHWQWSEKIAIGNTVQPGVFHHLDGSGRKHIAASSSKVAVVWEDESSTSPQIYLAEKSFAQNQFLPAVQLSTGSEAYEPAIAALASSEFVTVFEQDGAIYARLLSDRGLGKVVKLSAANASSASIASQGNNAFVVWREKHQNTYRLIVIKLRLENNQLVMSKPYSVETEALPTPILKPDIAVSDSAVFVAWEDRREGHTRLLYSHADTDDLQFSSPENLNEFFSGRNQYDKGSGVTRLSMTALAEDELLAAWMDKRRGGKGYGIFAAFGSSDDKSFGPNEKVHGKKGDEQPHYNPSVAGNSAGDFIVAWDDFRNSDLDIWLSRYNDDDEWGDDFSPKVASGPGEQSHASVTLDENGGLHLIWISRDDNSSPTGLWYSYGAAE